MGLKECKACCEDFEVKSAQQATHTLCENCIDTEWAYCRDNEVLRFGFFGGTDWAVPLDTLTEMLLSLTHPTLMHVHDVVVERLKIDGEVSE